MIVYVYILSQAHPPIEAPPIFLLRFHPDLLPVYYNNNKNYKVSVALTGKCYAL